MKTLNFGHHSLLNFNVNVEFHHDHLKKIYLSLSENLLVEVIGGSQKQTRKIMDWFSSYIHGKPFPIDELISFDSFPPFTQSVLKALTSIPFGETRTYSEIADQVGCPKGARAVGGACGRNPLLVLVPCHRVVPQQGLGGFAAGIHIKEALLKFESSSS